MQSLGEAEKKRPPKKKAGSAISQQVPRAQTKASIQKAKDRNFNNHGGSKLKKKPKIKDEFPEIEAHVKDE